MDLDLDRVIRGCIPPGTPHKPREQVTERARRHTPAPCEAAPMLVARSAALFALAALNEVIDHVKAQMG